MPEPASFDTFYRTHAPIVFRRARALLRSDADAHEVVQDLFLSLYERPEQLRARDSVVAFLYGATNHACLNRLRNQRNRARLRAEVLPREEASSAASPDAFREIWEVLHRLPPPLGDLAVYTYLDELTHEEIAPLLGVSRRQVGNLLERLHAWARTERSA